MSAEIERLLMLGRSTAEAGHWQFARRYFTRVLELDPDNEEALLWLAGLTEDPRESISYLQRVLRISPTNERAQEGLRWAQERLQNRPRQAARRSRKEPSRISVYWIATPLVLLVLLSVLWMAYSLIGNIGDVRAFLLPPTSTPTVTATATATATATGTATPTATQTPPNTPTPTATSVPTETPPPTPTPEPVKWIDVNVTTQTLVAYEGDVEVLRTTVSTGAPNTPTVLGTFRIFHKLVSQTMTGPDYVQPDVPYVMYFYGAYSLHGTYWHEDFGRARSHGCVNLRTEEAKWLFDWTTPVLPEGWTQIYDASGVGTLVVVHD